MKRVALISIGLVALVLAACAPSAVVATNVVPTIISLQVAADSNHVVLQGRYFGGGGEGSYVIAGANSDGQNGERVSVDLWSPTRIEFTAPSDTNGTFVFVVVDDIPSNGMPANLR
ncbi:MAG: hypothetical protein H0U69_10745 [Trueperaceae bacterium]|nr:hypothetical protein [Trueperaceae bacterium]